MAGEVQCCTWRGPQHPLDDHQDSRPRSLRPSLLPETASDAMHRRHHRRRRRPRPSQAVAVGNQKCVLRQSPDSLCRLAARWHHLQPPPCGPAENPPLDDLVLEHERTGHCSPQPAAVKVQHRRPVQMYHWPTTRPQRQDHPPSSASTGACPQPVAGHRISPTPRGRRNTAEDIDDGALGHVLPASLSVGGRLCIHSPLNLIHVSIRVAICVAID